VVKVPVDDQNPVGAGSARGAGRDRDVVEEAESHRLIGLGVVPRRAQEREPVGERSRQDRCRQVDETSRRQQGSVCRLPRRIGVGIELRMVAERGGLDAVDVLGGVDGEELLPRGLAGRDPPAARDETVRHEPAPDRRQSAGMLGVLVGRAVEEEPLVVDETGRRGHGKRLRYISQSATRKRSP